MTKYGSKGHFSAFSPGKDGRSQTRGSDIPEKPPKTGMFFVCRQCRHMMCNVVAFDERVDAPITIPGIRTSLDIKLALRSRIGVRFALECRRTWHSGKELEALDPTMTMRRPHSFTAASNCGSRISCEYFHV